jgi:hypothetical protein
VIISLSDCRKKRGATVIGVGYTFDPTAGGLKGETGDLEPLATQVPWYEDLWTEELGEDAAVLSSIPPPKCTGRHASGRHAGPVPPGDTVTCAGGRHPETGDMEPPCAWDAPCLRLQIWCAEKQIPPEQVIHGKTALELLAFIYTATTGPGQDSECAAAHGPSALSRLIVRQREGQPALPAGIVMPQLGMRATGATFARESVANRRAVLTGAILSLFEAVGERLGLSFAPSRAEAKPGEAFVLDRRQKNGYDSYLALYCKGSAYRASRFRRSIPLVRAELIPGLMAIDAYLPVNDMLPELDGLRENIRPKASGRFQCLVRLKDSLEIPVLVEIVAALAERGALRLDHVKDPDESEGAAEEESKRGRRHG